MRLALTEGIVCAEGSGNYGKIAVVFDNEEVGSATKQGADSTFLSDILLRIREALGKTDLTVPTDCKEFYDLCG